MFNSVRPLPLMHSFAPPIRCVEEETWIFPVTQH